MGSKLRLSPPSVSVGRPCVPRADRAKEDPDGTSRPDDCPLVDPDLELPAPGVTPYPLAPPSLKHFGKGNQ